ncbi:MAG: DUF3052 family protein [Myxococcales bacterium]|nr:DUF3052 family protein [Myxococcales bacterium]
MAGYSGTPLAKKLGLKDGHRLALLGAPEGFLGVLDPPELAGLTTTLRGRASIDVLLLFTTTARELARRFAPARDRMAKNGGLWVCWPKRASGVVTDLTETTIRAHGLAAGLVDNKVCDIDETWSGLRFVWRVADR